MKHLVLALALCLAGPSPSPKAASPLDLLVDALAAGDPAQAFSDLEEFVQAEDRPDPRAEARERAKLVVARFADIKKAAPAAKPEVPGELAQLLYTCGRALEDGGATADAKAVYEKIIKEYPQAVWQGGVTKETIAAQAQARLKYQTEKHPWIRPTLDALMSQLRDAFAKKDLKALGGLITRTGFWSGPFASEGGADDPERVLKLLDAKWGKVTVADSVEPFSEPDRQVFLKVSGFTGDFDAIYLILEKEPDGWQWSAVAFSAAPGFVDTPVPEVEASASPAPSPKPSVRAP